MLAAGQLRPSTPRWSPEKGINTEEHINYEKANCKPHRKLLIWYILYEPQYVVVSDSLQQRHFSGESETEVRQGTAHSFARILNNSLAIFDIRQWAFYSDIGHKFSRRRKYSCIIRYWTKPNLTHKNASPPLSLSLTYVLSLSHSYTPLSHLLTHTYSHS
jgi:hypothetical protein